MTTLREAAQQALEALEKYSGIDQRACDVEEALRERLAQPEQEPGAWTDADADAARLAMELEALLLDTKDTAAVSRWWDSAHDALELHRERLRAALAEPVQCRHCAKFFSQYRCSASTHGECDCPKCQGFCICEGGNGG